MSGSATFSGTTFQARVSALVYVHILSQARLGWLEQTDDTPVAISGETGGPGDDARIELGQRHPPVEVQAKHGLTAGGKLTKAILEIRDRSAVLERTKVVIVTDRGSSRSVHRDFAKDLERLRSGRRDGLKAEANRLVGELGASADLLDRLFVVPVDIDAAAEPEAKLTIQMLATVLEDVSQATAAWAVLVTDAGDLAAKRLRRTRKELVDLLGASGIKVRPPSPDDRFMRQLDFSKRLLEDLHADAVLTILAAIEPELDAAKVGPFVHYRLHQQRSAALMTLERPGEALAAARRAVDLDPSRPQALSVAALAAVQTGERELAESFAKRATEAGPDDDGAWSARALVASALGVSHGEPPSAVRESARYQTALAELALQGEEWEQVLSITAGLLERNVRSAWVLYFRATALVASGVGTADGKGTEQLREALRTTTEALDTIEDDHPLVTRLLVCRAEAHSALGQPAESTADFQRAHKIDGDDPVALGRLAEDYTSEGRGEEALRLLRSRVVDDHPILLVARARAFAVNGDGKAARRDLEAALGRADETPAPGTLRLNAAAVAMVLGDGVYAQRILEAVPPDTDPERQAVLRARIAFERQELDVGAGLFRKAAELASENRTALLTELGSRFLTAGHPQEAVTAFEEAGIAKLAPEAISLYARALMGAGEFARAATVIDGLPKSESLPDWALAISVEIALAQGDPCGTIDPLERLLEQHPQDHRVRAELVRRLLEVGQPEAAKSHVDALERAEPKVPAEMIELAHLLKQVGRGGEAVDLAYRALRQAPQDPSINRWFASLLLFDPPSLPLPMEVAAGTSVRLASDEGAESTYVICAEEPVERLRGEITVADATPYLGKRVGDVVTLHRGAWQETRWKVEEILPAAVHAFRDVTAHYQERFPNEPFFVAAFKLPEEGSLRYFARLISSLYAKRASADQAFKIYRENTLPLGFVARVLGASVADVMAAATMPGGGLGPLAVEWTDLSGHEESRGAARHATTVVLTRSALESAFDLELLDHLASAFTWVAPQSLLNALKHELAESEDRQRKGLSFLMSGDAGVQLEEVGPDDPRLAVRPERLRRLVGWLTVNARIDLRPLETIGRSGSEEEEARDAIGYDSYDAYRLAEHARATMYADDLGLRRFLPQGAAARSFSTPSLLPILAERGVITGEDRDRMLLQLVDRNYTLILPTQTLLRMAIRQPDRKRADVVRVFGLLAAAPLDLASAARIAIETLRGEIVAPIQQVGLETLVGIELEIMSSRWGAAAAAGALAAAATSALALLPKHVEMVRKVAKGYLISQR